MKGLIVKPPPIQTALPHDADTIRKLEVLRKLAITSFAEVEQALNKLKNDSKSISSGPQLITILTSVKQVSFNSDRYKCH